MAPSVFNMNLYNQRGVSAQKEDVHAAIQTLDPGLFAHAFCKVYPDFIGGDAGWVNFMHADGAGTKSILAYLYWKETGDLNVWKGIAKDAVAMNLDDLLCVGVHDNFLFSSTIDRNKNRIPGEVLKAIIEGTNEYFELLRKYDVNIAYLGGETADVGDLVRTIAVNGTLMARQEKRKLITNDKIAPGQVIVGFASSGLCSYEHEYNSGLGSNGLTSARHDVLSNFYREHYPETFEETLPPEVVYIGKHRLTDKINIAELGTELEIGKLLLSPTRTYAPLVKRLLATHFQDIAGIIHCSGGGQTKVLKYLPENMTIVKDNLPEPPFIFRMIKEQGGGAEHEMYQVYNMGIRLEVFTTASAASSMIRIAGELGIDARITGRVEEGTKKKLQILSSGKLWLEYEG